VFHINGAVTLKLRLPMLVWVRGKSIPQTTPTAAQERALFKGPYQ